MRITTDHARSSYGVPVILDDNGNVMDYPDGVRAAVARLGWSRQELADRTGRNLRSVERWFHKGNRPDVAVLNVLADALRALEN